MSGLTLDTSSLEAAMLFVERETGRAMPESLNRAALHTIIGSGSYPGAMQLTPKAATSAIDAIPYKKIAGFVAAKLRKQGRIKKKGQRGGRDSKGRFLKNVGRSDGVSNSQFKQMVKKERSRRKSASGYAAFAGWNNASKAVGGRGLNTKPGFEKSEAAKGTGEKATGSDLTAMISNTAPAIERIGAEALQQGLENAAKDLNDYGLSKMKSIFQKVNPR